MSDENDEAFEQLLRRVARTPDISKVYRHIGPGVQLAGRFDVEQRLGAGGMGQVVAAFDRAREARVALKFLGKMTPHAIVLLKREFRAAAELAHPNLVRLHELFSDGLEWFFTMELVDGVTLPGLGPLAPDAELLRDVFRQLAWGLGALHQAGMIHADLKPSNFLITNREQRVVLLDFGLARPIGLDKEGEFSGTPAYMAPEQALGQTLSEAADWYAFGVVLYEALTGVLPLRRPSSERLAKAPPDLAALCMELLRFAPGDRPRADEIFECIGQTRPPRSFSTAPQSSRRALVGRERELSQLALAFERSVAGKPALVLVQGPSGIGKSALVREFGEGLEARGATLIAGDCRERESMGFKAVDGLIDGVVRLLDRLPPDEAEPLLPEHIAELTIVFPALRAAQVVARARKETRAAPSQGLVRLRAIAAFTELLRRLRRRAPLVLWIDDLQWADAESTLLLGPALGGDSPVPLLFIGSLRSSGNGRGPLLDPLFAESTWVLPEPLELCLSPLEPADAERLARELLPAHGAQRSQVARDIGRDAGGHPLFIAELVHAAAGAGEVRQAPANLAALVSERVAALPDDARRLLELVAIAGIPLARSVLRQARLLGLSEAEQALDLLKANRLARSHGLKAEDTVDIHHDRIREIVAQGLSDVQRCRHHLSLATVLAEEPASPAPLVASHFEAAGELARAGEYWLSAAGQAAAALAFDHAVELYEKGLSLAELAADARRAARVQRALALAHAGKGERAASAYLEAALGAGPEEELELKRQAAEQLLLSGHVERGLVVIEEVLGAIGLPRPQSGRHALLSLLFGRLRLRARGLAHTSRHESELSRETLSRLDASWSVSCSLGVIDPIRGADFQTKHLVLALEAGEPRRVLRALTVEASYEAASGLKSERRTRELLEVADSIARKTDDYAALGFFHMARGLVAYLQGRLVPALGDLEQALEILTTRSRGAIWETVTTRRFVIAALFFQGQLKRLGEFVPPLLAEAESTGNRYAIMCFRTAYAWAAWLAKDDVGEAARQLARTEEEWQTSGYQLSHCNILIGRSYVDLYRGDAEAAFERLEHHWERAQGAQLFRIGVLRVQLWQLRAAIAALAALRAAARGEATRARELRRDARRFTRRLLADPLGRARPLGLSIEAALAAAEGNSDAACRGLEASIAGFDAEHMRLFSAAARVRLGALLGGTRGELLAQGGHAEFRREGVSNPSRMIAMLAPGFAAAEP